MPDGIRTHWTYGPWQGAHNNIAENAIRPFALGRRNWLFCNNTKGANASAAIYSIIETAKANQIPAEQYLKHLLEKLPYCQTEADYQQLLPQRYQMHLPKN